MGISTLLWSLYLCIQEQKTWIHHTSENSEKLPYEATNTDTFFCYKPLVLSCLNYLIQLRMIISAQNQQISGEWQTFSYAKKKRNWNWLLIQFPLNKSQRVLLTFRLGGLSLPIPNGYGFFIWTDFSVPWLKINSHKT